MSDDRTIDEDDEPYDDDDEVGGPGDYTGVEKITLKRGEWLRVLEYCHYKKVDRPDVAGRLAEELCHFYLSPEGDGQNYHTVYFTYFYVREEDYPVVKAALDFYNEFG